MINPLQHIEESWRNICFAKLRSLLALLGILVGTASVVAMVLGGELAMHEALKQFKSLGTDLLAASMNEITTNEHGTGKRSDLNLMQALQIAQSDAAIKQIAPYTQLYLPSFFTGQTLNASMLGVTDTFANLMHLTVADGRFISFADQYEFYCVIGDQLAKEIHDLSGRSPLGELIQVGKNMLLVIGILNPWTENNFIYTNIDTSILVPLRTSTLLSKYSTIENILFRLSPDANIVEVEQHISEHIQSLSINKQINFRSAKELIAKMKKQSEILTIFLGLIGSISLLVGGIGVMNIMLVSVIERRREIGIRLAVGATQRDISILFLVEAIMLSLIGGILGIVTGILIAYLIALFSGWEFNLFIWPIVVGFCVSVAVGIFFGFYPAYRASRLDPIAALRMEE